jgi:hypothetical protein
VFLRRLLMLVTIVLLLGCVRAGGSIAPDERPAHGFASTSAAGAPDLDPGSEATLAGAATLAPPQASANHVLCPPPPVFVGRLHAVRLFRPPRLAPLA